MTKSIEDREVFLLLDPLLVCPIWKASMLVTQSCPTLWDPMDCSLPGSTVHGICQARILKRIAISYSRGSSLLEVQTQVSYVSSIGRQILYH